MIDKENVGPLARLSQDMLFNRETPSQRGLPARTLR